MFIHFSPTTYLDETDHLQPDHAPPRQGRDGILGTADDLSPGLLNPRRLDCLQWADGAAAAKMKFGVLTTKHHDGFCNWPSRYSDYTVAQGCGRDVVGEFAKAFRERGLHVGLYYSIRDRTAEIGDSTGGGVDQAKVELIKNQLTELLTKYGPILYIVFDGWGNEWHESPTYQDLDYGVIHRHIKSIQPECLVLNHTTNPAVSDVMHIEMRHGVPIPRDDRPAVGGHTLQPTWFWQPEYPQIELRSAQWVVNENLVPLNKANKVFQLNCAPNRDGLMDDNVMLRLQEIGRNWTPPSPLGKVPDSWRDWPVPGQHNG
jgi:alpha-L-fucosidase